MPVVRPGTDKDNSAWTAAYKSGTWKDRNRSNPLRPSRRSSCEAKRAGTNSQDRHIHAGHVEQYADPQSVARYLRSGGATTWNVTHRAGTLNVLPSSSSSSSSSPSSSFSFSSSWPPQSG